MTSFAGRSAVLHKARKVAVGAAGMAATVVLHSLFLVVAIMGAGSKKIARLPDAIGAGANSGQFDGSSSERMILVRVSMDISSADPESTEMAELKARITPSPLQVTGPDVLPPPPLHFEEQGEPTEASEADLIARTKLAGMYESQIRARIERGWSPPQTPEPRPASCRVKIIQQRDGRIEDVELEDCVGSLEWLDSLKKAIYVASPLPGAPHPSVFAESFSMRFRSDAAQQ